MNFMHWVQVYGYTGMFVMLALEYIILIVPGETTLTTVGILWKNGSSHFHFLPLLAATSLGTFTGAMVAYAIGRFLGRPIVLKYGKYVFLTEARLRQSERLFERQMILTLALSRYIAVVRDVIPYIAGINKVKLRIFVPVIFLSSILWTASFLAAGTLIGQALSFVLAHWKIAIVPAVLICVAGYFAYRALHKKMEGALSGDEPEEPVSKTGNTRSM